MTKCGFKTNYKMTQLRNTTRQIEKRGGGRREKRASYNQMMMNSKSIEQKGNESRLMRQNTEKHKLK